MFSQEDRLLRACVKKYMRALIFPIINIMKGNSPLRTKFIKSADASQQVLSSHGGVTSQMFGINLQYSVARC